MLQELFISKVRVDILKLMLLNPEKALHVRAIVRAVGVEINAIRRELTRLEGVNILTKRQSGNRIYYTANPSHIFYSELVSLLAKESGVCEALISNLKHLGKVKYISVAKDFLRGRKATPLDVDIFIVGDNVKEDLLNEIISSQEKILKAEINFSIMGFDEFMLRKRQQDNFVTRVLIQPRTMLVGDESEFSSLI